MFRVCCFCEPIPLFSLCANIGDAPVLKRESFSFSHGQDRPPHHLNPHMQSQLFDDFRQSDIRLCLYHLCDLFQLFTAQYSFTPPLTDTKNYASRLRLLFRQSVHRWNRLRHGFFCMPLPADSTLRCAASGESGQGKKPAGRYYSHTAAQKSRAGGQNLRFPGSRPGSARLYRIKRREAAVNCPREIGPGTG